MSARYLPRQLGVVISCNIDGCTARHQTANIRKKVNRAAAAQVGWIRGGMPHKKRWDICPAHAAEHLAEVAEHERKQAEIRAAREENLKLLFASREANKQAKARRKAERAARKAEREARKQAEQAGASA